MDNEDYYRFGIDLRKTGLYLYASALVSIPDEPDSREPVPGLKLPITVPTQYRRPDAGNDDLNARIQKVRVLLQEDDEALDNGTRRAVAIGRHLLAIKAAKVCRHGQFRTFLQTTFPNKSWSTLHEYMALAREFDAADEVTKVQLTGLFPKGWTAVLGELRRRKKEACAKKHNGQATKGDIDAEKNRILQGDCMARLRELPDDSVDTIITSPPYYRGFIFPESLTEIGGDPSCCHDWDMRQRTHQHYEHPERSIETGTCRVCGARRVMLGWEETVQEYIEDVRLVFKEMSRVLKPSGVLWVNIGHTYDNKKMLLIPERLVIALEGNGWIIRQQVIWHITNRAPEAVHDRCTRSHEPVYMLTKNEHYFYDAGAIREPAVSPNSKKRTHYHGFNRGITPQVDGDGMRNKRSVWPIPHERFGGDHYCVFPKELIEPMVLSSCPEGGTCLDPFGGTGTVGLVALAHNRKAILIEASARYCGMARQRIETELEPYKASLNARRQIRLPGPIC